MFTINFKGYPNPKDKKLVKIEMILFRTGYNRTPKVLNIGGLYKDWDQTTQNFRSKSKDAISKNQILFDLKMKYIKIAENWENEGIEWSPVQWSHYFETQREEQKGKIKSRVLTVSQCIDAIIEELKKRKRCKNGKAISSAGTARKYYYLRYTLRDFTKEVYNKNFSTYFFNDINEKFLKDYIFYIQERGAKKGNKGGVNERLRGIRGVLYYANEMGIPNTDFSVMDAVKSYMKKKRTTPQTIPYKIVQQIEQMDKSDFNEREQLYIDLFLFTFYSGGMVSVDMSYLTWDCIENDIISYERIKFPKKAQMPFTDKAKAIVEKYKGKCCKNYVLPILTEKQITEKQEQRRIKRIREKVNQTLKKVSRELNIEEFHWYAARGAFITKMIDEGYHPVAVAEFAGNSPRTIYNHYWKQTKPEDVLADMNQMF